MIIDTHVLFFLLLRIYLICSERHALLTDEKKIKRKVKNFYENDYYVKLNKNKDLIYSNRLNNGHNEKINNILRRENNSRNVHNIDNKYSIESSIQDDKIMTMSIKGKHNDSPDDEQINQDRAFVMSPFNSDNVGNTFTNAMIGAGSNSMLLGVFDGHGDQGEIVSSYALEKLPIILSTKLKGSDDQDEKQETFIKQVLTESIIEIDSSLTDDAGQNGGCTASIILVHNDNIYVANTGDSLSFIATYNKSSKKSKLIYKSRRDKPSLADENERIIKMGGTVTDDRLCYSYSDNYNEYTSSLAMSRSIGDYDFKKVGNISDPIVDVIRSKDFNYLHSNDNIKVFAVSVTDGILDYVSPEVIANKIAKSLYEDENNGVSSSSVKQFITDVAMTWDNESNGEYRDDISIALNDISYLFLSKTNEYMV